MKGRQRVIDFHLRCLVRGRTLEGQGDRYVCPDHGSERALDVVYDDEAIGGRMLRIVGVQAERSNYLAVDWPKEMTF